jgi:hypothetical protein
VDTFGAMSFRDPVMRPIREFLAEVGNKNHGMLWDTLSQTKGLAPENIGFTAGNIATLLCLQKQVFTGRSLAGIALLGAEIGFELDSVDLTGAIARKTSFRNANLRNAKMKDIELDPGSLVGADLRDVEGVDDRFYRFVSYPFIEPFWPSARRRAESSLIYDFDAALGNDRPNVLLLHGARSLDPRNTGPLDALLGIARTAFGRLHRGVFYFSLFRRSSFFIAKFRTWSTARWPSLDFYRSLATFMTISGCPELYQFLEAEALLGQGAVVAAENDPEILSIIKSAFQKNRWVIFIDAAGFSSADRNIFPLLKTLASEGLATRIFVAVKDVPAELLGKHLQAINLSWLTLKSGA